MVADALVEDDIERVVEGPLLSLACLLCIEALVGAYHLAVHRPGELSFVPLQSIDVPLGSIDLGMEGMARRLGLLGISSPKGVSRMVGVWIETEEFHDIDLAAIRMRRSRLLRQQPCSRKIARQHIGAHPQFYLAILEGKATARIDRPSEHRGGITALTGIGDGTADQFAVADKDHIRRLTDPAVPARRTADAPLPHLWIGLGTILQVKLVTEHQLIA